MEKSQEMQDWVRTGWDGTGPPPPPQPSGATAAAAQDGAAAAAAAAPPEAVVSSMEFRGVAAGPLGSGSGGAAAGGGPAEGAARGGGESPASSERPRSSPRNWREWSADFMIEIFPAVTEISVRFCSFHRRFF
jgi:hypothetical protein